MSGKRRLLFVSHEMTLSGAPIQLAYLAKWLQEHDWKVSVVAPEPGPLTRHLAGVEILYESQLLIDPYYGALRRLAPQFDAVVANTIATWEAVQACHLENVPVIWYIHETQVGVQLMQLVHMMEPSLSLADALVTPTKATAAIYAPFRAEHIEVIPYGIPAVPPMPRAAADRVTFTVIGTCERRKGQDIFLEAVCQLSGEVSALARFQIAGRELEEPFCGALRARSLSCKNVKLLGSLEHEEAMRLLTQTDVLVCPSRDETMPIVLLEAMSLGKAILSTAVGGIDEWIQDGANGLLVPAEDAAALAAAMERLMCDAELRGRLGLAGRETYDRHFTIDRYGDQFAEVIRAVIERTAAPVA